MTPFEFWIYCLAIVTPVCMVVGTLWFSWAYYLWWLVHLPQK